MTRKPSKAALALAARAAEREAIKRAAERDADRDPARWGLNAEALVLQPDVAVRESHRGGLARAVRKSGVDWLFSKGRLSTHQLAAALKYGDLYRTANDVSIRSCADDSVGSGNPLPAQLRRRQAFSDISRVRALALVGHKGLVSLCDKVAGEGMTIRALSASDAEAVKNETAFCIALDLIAQHYGIVAPCTRDSSTSSG